jgi:1,4-dihydroxy-2-naphthoate octaprenyltransferase
MPVYWLALSQTVDIVPGDAIIIFVILHLLVYPASNGYNSYMDRDTSSIGGIKNPRLPTRQLFHITILLDAIALLMQRFYKHLVCCSDTVIYSCIKSI